MGGPVRVKMVDGQYSDTIGQGALTMNLNSDRDKLLPGMGIDMQAIAKVTSSDINATPALLRAILTVDVEGVNANLAADIEYLIQDAMTECLTTRIDSSEVNARDG